MASFCFVIPTLQRAATLPTLVDRLVAHPLVDQIIVINNAVTPVGGLGAKVTVLEPGHNIFVNPAWNLGVEHASATNLAICNDDVLFPTEVLEPVAALLGRRVGVVGPSTSCFSQPPGLCQPRFHRIVRRPYGFGTLMFMKRSHYVPIPDSLKIWYGDDYLFLAQRHRNVSFSGVGIETVMGTTSTSPEFAAQIRAEGPAFDEAMKRLGLTQRILERTAMRSLGAARSRARSAVRRIVSFE